MAATPVFPTAKMKAGLYESFYLRAVSPVEPVGAWIRYTVHKRPGAPPKGSLWLTVFDASRGRPFMHKETTDVLCATAEGWIAVGEHSRFGSHLAVGRCGAARWELVIESEEPELRHLHPQWLYRAPLPRTKLTSPAPVARLDGEIVLPGRTVELRGWHGMVGHNWGTSHAERWIWLHGIDFDASRTAWVDLAVGRVRVAGSMTPWVASGAVGLHGRRLRVGGISRRGVAVAESAARCRLSLPCESGASVEADVEVPGESAAGWRYADPDGGEHDVVNCSVAALTLTVRPHRGRATTLHTAHGGAYELGMREHDHGVQLAPFEDG